jgi:hypothetical protein
MNRCYFLGRYMFLTAQEGVILRVEYDQLLGLQPAALPVAINLRALQRQGSTAATGLPQWIYVLTRQDTRARLQGVCALPAVASTVTADGTRDRPPAWQQE